MLGLSITAIGARPLQECLNIYQQLQPKLQLDFLELAVGSRCDLTQIPQDIPLVLHNRCLFEELIKLPFSLAEPDTWQDYMNRLSDRNVKMISVHPPKRSEITLTHLKQNRDSLESLLGVPVCLEVMPNENWWLCKEDFVERPQDLSDIPLLLDISHVNIWAKGRESVGREWVSTLLPQAIAIHLSHNNGRRDSHDLIPSDIWFNVEIETWKSQGYVLTYESLPEAYSKWERMDKQRGKRK